MRHRTTVSICTLAALLSGCAGFRANLAIEGAAPLPFTNPKPLSGDQVKIAAITGEAPAASGLDPAGLVAIVQALVPNLSRSTSRGMMAPDLTAKILDRVTAGLDRLDAGFASLERWMKEFDARAAAQNMSASPSEPWRQWDAAAWLDTAATAPGLELIVHLNPGEPKYHRAGCVFIEPTAVMRSLREATEHGRKPCKTCGEW